MRLAPLLALALTLPATAQTTFTVSVGTKTSQHPLFGQGHDEGYVVDENEGATLTLVRGQTYTFQMNNVANIHPFYLTTSATGGGGSAYTNGVTGNFATGDAAVTFTVPQAAPDLLWYQCGVHSQMGGRLTIVSPSDVEGGVSEPVLEVVSANPARDEVRLALTTAGAASARLAVFALDGRLVATLHDGPLGGATAHPFVLDTSGLAAGVYVVRATAGAWTGERRVTVVR